MKTKKLNLGFIPILLGWLIAAAVFFVIAFFDYRIDASLGDPAVLTGWSLVSLFIFLSLFSIRKRLSMIPLGSAKTWLFMHAICGVLALAVFWLHTRLLWPKGLYEQILTAIFYFVTASGIAGYILQRIYPSRLTQTGIEVIYERIPAEISDLREKAEMLMKRCSEETKIETLQRHYEKSLKWFFEKPRFFMNHVIIGHKGAHWVQQQCNMLKRYCDEAELGYLEKLESLAELKNKVDFHYTAQGMMKGWLFFHVPPTLGLLLFMIWHIVMVYVYVL